MEKIGIIAGSYILKTKFWKVGKKKKIKTPFGDFKFAKFKNLTLVCRHGEKGKIPPHKIIHQLNIFGFKKLGIKYIVSLNSVGSLKKKIKPDHFLVPSDFIDFDPPTFFDKKTVFTTPSLSQKLRKILLEILKKMKIKFWSKGIYFNSKGPRLETKAEINLIKKFADVVGMTMAKEATLAKELNLEYASVCSVDNFAHGIVKKPLKIEKILENQKRSAKIFERIIENLINENFD